MRKLLLSSVGACIALGYAAGAYADVNVLAYVDKDRDKRVFEDIDIDKDIYLDVFVDSFADRFAESIAIGNQRNNDNTACENCAEKTDLLEDSESFNSGITSVNMASGNMNNQGTAISFGFTSGGGLDGYTEAMSALEQINEWNTIKSINILFRAAIVDNSINSNNGLTYANLATGQMTNQANVLSLAVGDGGGVAIAESDLGQFNRYNDVDEGGLLGVTKSATVVDSINSNIGITGVNVSSGNMGNQANVVSVAWSAAPVNPAP